MTSPYRVDEDGTIHCGVTRTERAMCRYCLFYSPGATHPRCIHPAHNSSHTVELSVVCEEINPKGDCPTFAPTMKTRFLRFFGHRPKVYR